MRVLVCGGRDFRDRDWLRGVLDELWMKGELSFLIEGGQMSEDPITGERWGADFFALNWRLDKGVPGKAFPANWDKHRRAAGPIRNQQMIDEGKPDLVLAFPGGRGTADMVRRAKKAGVNVVELRK